MAKQIYENRFILTRKLHKEYYRSRYKKLRFRRIFFLGYRMREWLHYRQLQSEHGKAVVNIVSFDSDRIHVRVNTTSFYFKYSTITEAEETDELLLLYLREEGMATHVQLLWKGGFTGHPPLEEFKAYLNKRTGKELFKDISEQ
ncbi:MAG: YcxB family protein [Lachnospiraceae bacterium]|nr:YcxB family protein [Lachnospiraceae bacterium]